MAYRANTSFGLGSRRIVTVGTLIAVDDKDLKQMLKGNLLTEVDEFLEAATAAPGERRAVSPPKKKAKKKVASK